MGLLGLLFATFYHSLALFALRFVVMLVPQIDWRHITATEAFRWHHKLPSQSNCPEKL